MHFTKMSAMGNDYVYVELLTQSMEEPEKWARFLSDRRFGVGSDGMILICPSERADFRMRVFNPDGSEAEMCGNALRSVGKFVYEKNFTSKTALRIETLGGIKKVFLTLDGGHVSMITAYIGEPVLDAARVPVLMESGEGRCVDAPLTVCGREFRITAMSLGNPHCAVFADDAQTLDLEKYGGAIERSAVFPQRANVEFVRVDGNGKLFLRTWERNCGETLACGTGCLRRAGGGSAYGTMRAQSHRKAAWRLYGSGMGPRRRPADNDRPFRHCVRRRDRSRDGRKGLFGNECENPDELTHIYLLPRSGIHFAAYTKQRAFYKNFCI